MRSVALILCSESCVSKHKIRFLRRTIDSQVTHTRETKVQIFVRLCKYCSAADENVKIVRHYCRLLTIVLGVERFKDQYDAFK